MSTLLLSVCALLSFVESQKLLTPTSTDRITYEIYNATSSSQIWNDYITCTTSSCTVICGLSKGCYGLSIDASQSNTLQITCSATSSCKNMVITSGAQISTEIDCTDAASCYNANFDVNDSPTVGLNCNYHTDASKYIPGTSSTCNYVVFNASLSTNVNVNCKGSYSCYQTDIYADYASSITMDVASGSAFKGGHFHASNAGYVSITCWNSYSCQSVWYLSNDGNTYIYCYGNGACYWFTIYVNNSLSGISFNVNGDNECCSISECIGSWKFNCNNNSESDYFNGSSCKYGTCGCTAIDVTFTDDSSVTSSYCKSIDLGIIIGGICGGLCLIVIMIWLIRLWFGKKCKKEHSPPPDVENKSVMMTQQQQQQPDVTEKEEIPNPSAPTAVIEDNEVAPFAYNSNYGIKDGENEGLNNNDNNDNNNGENKYLDIKEWFNNEIDLDEYNEIYFKMFIENGFDKFKLIKQITKNDLIQIGINKLGHQKQILSVIANLDVSCTNQ